MKTGAVLAVTAQDADSGDTSDTTPRPVIQDEPPLHEEYCRKPQIQHSKLLLQ